MSNVEFDYRLIHWASKALKSITWKQKKSKKSTTRKKTKTLTLSKNIMLNEDEKKKPRKTTIENCVKLICSEEVKKSNKTKNHKEKLLNKKHKKLKLRFFTPKKVEKQKTGFSQLIHIPQRSPILSSIFRNVFIASCL